MLEIPAELYPPRAGTPKESNDPESRNPEEMLLALEKRSVRSIGIYEKMIFVLKLLKRWLILLILLPLLCGAAAWTYSNYYAIPLYAAKSTLLVQPQNMSTQNMYNSIMGNQQLIKTYEGLLKTRTIANDVSRRLDNAVTPDKVLENMSVKTSNVTFLIALTYTDTNSERAVRVVNEIAHSFSQNVSIFVNLDNVMIVDEALPTEDAKPISPRIVINVLLAAFLGFMVSVAFITVFEAMRVLMRLLKETEIKMKAEGRGLK